MNHVSVARFVRRLLVVSAGLAAASVLSADSLTKNLVLDFFRDVPSRNLKGLATRSDGRLVPGPVLRDLAGAAPAELLWCLERGQAATQWYVGTGSEGKIFDVTVDYDAGTYASRVVAKLDDAQVLALRRLPDGSLLAGTSPKGQLCLVRDGKLVARVALPVDSIFDILLPATPAAPLTALVATGNPGRIYRVDLAQFAAAGVSLDKVSDSKVLAERGLTLFGEIRDRNVRRIAQMADGRIVAGSSPRGSLYTFPRDGGAPLFLNENRDAEVTDLLPQPDGGLYATVIYTPAASNEPRNIRVVRTMTAGTPVAAPGPGGGPGNPGSGPVLIEAPAPDALNSSGPERFAGRSVLLWFPPDGFPEVVVNRNNLAFYRVLPHAGLMLLAGGEQGDLLGYDPALKHSLTFAGSVAAQLNGLAAVPDAPDRFLALKNNAPGFALIDFRAAGPREAETRRLDFNILATLGALRFNRVRGLTPSIMQLDARVSNGTDDVEGWGPWTTLVADPGDLQTSVGWRSPTPLRGRYARLRIKLPAAPDADAALDRAGWFHLPQNRRPQLGDFRIMSPNFGLIPVAEQAGPPTATLGQVLNQGNDAAAAEKRRSQFLNSHVVPAPGTQVALWTVTDPDGDALACTFSLRREGDKDWTDMVVNTRDPFAQFEISHLSEGVYFTRLFVAEQAPRPAADRLSVTFETDDLVVDRTPPELIEATARKVGDRVVLTIHGRDALSLIVGFEAQFNNGAKDATEQPLDGARDSRDETFVLDVPLSRVADATNVEITLYDSAGNAVSRRLTW